MIHKPVKIHHLIERLFQKSTGKMLRERRFFQVRTTLVDREPGMRIKDACTV